MAAALLTSDQIDLQQAVGLVSQQIWCWGRDIMRPQGNWLIEFGFDRVQPPADRSECPSLYRLRLPHGRCVLLRGFGVFYSDSKLGGVFLPRYAFQPRYTRQAELTDHPWTKADLPNLRRPTASRRQACSALLSDLIDWVWRYEQHIIAHLGIAYRRATLQEWDDGTRTVVPAEAIAPAWRALSCRVASGFDTPGPGRRLESVSAARS